MHNCDKRVVIISGGVISDYDYIKSHITCNDIIICADSGFLHAEKMELTPSAVVGDFDSIADTKIPADIPKLRQSAKKDMTDTEIAVDYARKQGFCDFLLIGATGKRMDHSLANILLLKSFVTHKETAVIIDEYNKIMLTNSVLQIQEKPSTLISLIPLVDCYGVTTENLEYPLFDATMLVGTENGLGVSNVATKPNASVRVKSGFLMVIIARD